MNFFRIFLPIFLFFNIIYSQSDEEVGITNKFGLGGGYTPMWFMPNFDGINEKINVIGLESFSNSGMYVSGGAGYAYILFIENLRLGGMGFGGSTSTQKLIDAVNKEVIYSVGGGGLTMEYTLPAISAFALSFGVILGAGSLDIEIFENSGEGNWDNIWDQPNPSIRRYTKLKNSFFTLTPTVNMDFILNRFMSLRVGGGYLLPILDDWKLNNEQNINGIPTSLNANSFFIQTGIFVGFFAF